MKGVKGLGLSFRISRIFSSCYIKIWTDSLGFWRILSRFFFFQMKFNIIWWEISTAFFWAGFSSCYFQLFRSFDPSEPCGIFLWVLWISFCVFEGFLGVEDSILYLARIFFWKINFNQFHRIWTEWTVHIESARIIVQHGQIRSTRNTAGEYFMIYHGHQH